MSEGRGRKTKRREGEKGEGEGEGRGRERKVGEMRGRERRTHGVAADGGDDGLAGLREERPALEELVLEHVRVCGVFRWWAHSRNTGEHSHCLSFISLMSAPATGRTSVYRVTD